MPFGDIVRLHDGTLGVCIYSWQPPGEHNVYFYSSDDDGRTWARRGTIQEGNINETTPLVLPDGQLLACARTLDDQHLELFRSTDRGHTWQREQPLTGAMEHPAHLLNLSDGRILLTYGRRNADNAPQFLGGIGYRVSPDAGRTWTEPTPLVESMHRPDMRWPHSDGGYPSSVQLDDGQILTAWYTSAMPRVHERYHMATAIWSLPNPGDNHE